MLGESEKRAAPLGLSADKTLIDLSSPRNQGVAEAASAKPQAAELTRLGDYRILGRLGEGGMGAVYLGVHDTDKQQVAIKVLASQHSGNQAALDRFYREKKSGELLKHPNIVRMLTIGQDRRTGLHYLVMEYVDGPSLEDLLEEFGKLSVADAVHIVLDVARGLEHVHSRNIVHRDVKPGNILITPAGLAKLTDLGLAKRIDEASHLTAAQQGFGTPYYMPYEQAVNAKAADARGDIYALGATFYHLIVGEPPFTGSNAMEVVDKKNAGDFTPASSANPEVPKILDPILARMLAREPRHRYQTASDLIVDLERTRLAADMPSFVDPERTPREPMERQRPESPRAVTVGKAAQTPVRSRFWFLRFRDKQGHWRKAKLTVTQILRRHRQGTLPSSVEVSPHIQGDFRPLQAFSEFQDAVAKPIERKPTKGASTPPVPPRPASSVAFWSIIVGTLGIGVVLLLLIWLFLLR